MERTSSRRHLPSQCPMCVQYDCPPLRVYFALPCTSVRPMRLTIEWRSRTVAIEGFAPAPRPASGAGRHGNRCFNEVRLVWASGKPEEVYLDLTSLGVAPTLWICGTAFELSEEEARWLDETLGPVGPRIERRRASVEGNPSAATGTAGAL